MNRIRIKFKISEHVIEDNDGLFKLSKTPMVDLGTYLFKYSNTGKLYLDNCLPMLTPNKYVSQSMHVLPLNN